MRIYASADAYIRMSQCLLTRNGIVFTTIPFFFSRPLIPRPAAH